jgi:hypothetical protein
MLPHTNVHRSHWSIDTHYTLLFVPDFKEISLSLNTESNTIFTVNYLAAVMGFEESRTGFNDVPPDPTGDGTDLSGGDCGA